MITKTLKWIWEFSPFFWLCIIYTSTVLTSAYVFGVWGVIITLLIPIVLLSGFAIIDILIDLFTTHLPAWWNKRPWKKGNRL